MDDRIDRKLLELLHKLAGAQPQRQNCAAERDFLHSGVKRMAWREGERCRAVVRDYEKRYISWEKFAAAVEGQASVEQQLHRAEWQEAREGLRAWKKFDAAWPQLRRPAAVDYNIYTERVWDAEYEKYLETLYELARPLVQAGRYATVGDFLRDFLRDYARQQAEEERRAVLGFERQFISWEKFNDAIMNIATREQDDIAFDWEWARDGAAYWQKLLKELGQAAPVPDDFEQSP